MIDPNARFLTFLRKLGPQAPAYKLAHLHVSQLPASKKSRENISRAISMFSELKTKFRDGEVFLLKNLDIVFMAKDISKPMIAAVCDVVRQSFIGQLEVTFTNVHGGVGEFFTLFELSYQYNSVLVWAEDLFGGDDSDLEAIEKPAPSEAVGKAAGEPAAPRKPHAVDMVMMARIKAAIQKVDITHMFSRQSVYGMQNDGKVQFMWEEVYISVKMLEAKFCPGQSLTAHNWLFNDLTEELDAIVLKLLAEPGERDTRRRISLNVNISTLASSRFLNFDAELPLENRQGVVLEISKTDIFENMKLYRELLPFLRDRGYRLLVDGLSLHHVDAMDLDGIPCDLMKLFWTGAESEFQEAIPERIIGKIRMRQSPLLVLAHCDTAESLRFARDTGIKIVQGRLIDHMVKSRG